MKYASLAIHGGRREDAEIKGVNYPLYLSSTFVQDSIGDYGEFVYSRSNNPTRNNVEQLIAQLEEAKYGLAMASGMGATALAFSLLKPGDKVLVNSNVYESCINQVLTTRSFIHIQSGELPGFIQRKNKKQRRKRKKYEKKNCINFTCCSNGSKSCCMWKQFKLRFF